MELSWEEARVLRISELLRSANGSLSVGSLTEKLSSADPEGTVRIGKVFGGITPFVKRFPARFGVSLDQQNIFLVDHHQVRVPQSLEEWNTFFVQRLRDAGGSMRLGSLMGQDSFDLTLLEEIRRQGGLKKFLERLGPHFVFEGAGGLMTVRCATSLKAKTLNSNDNGKQQDASTAVKLTDDYIMSWIVSVIRRKGGSCTLASLLTDRVDIAKAVREAHGGLRMFLEKQKHLLRIEKIGTEPTAFFLESKHQPQERIVVENSSSKERKRLTGTVVSLVGQKCFIRDDSKDRDCPHEELFYVSRTRFRSQEDGRRAAVNMRVSFSTTALEPSPNPFADDVVIIGSSSAEASNGNADDINSNVDGDASFDTPIEVISDAAVCGHVCERLAQEKVLALDCEGVDLGRPGGSLSLVQIASSAGAYIFDVKEAPTLFECGLKEVLESPRILKVLHDCRKDISAIAEMGVFVRSVFDTQVAYAVQNSTNDVSFKTMLKKITGKTKPEGPHLRNRMFWAERPLSKIALNYAASDVVYLLEAARLLIIKFSTASATERARRLSNARVSAAVRELEVTRENGERAAHMNPEEAFADLIEANCRTDQSVVHHCLLEKVDDLKSVLDALPSNLSKALLNAVPNAEKNLVDVVMDLESPITFIRSSGPSVRVQDCIVTEDDLEAVLSACGRLTDAHRACVGQSLHRCSVIIDPCSSDERPVGLTLRMARVVYGIAGVLRDVLVSGKSILLVGPPGRGKTTLLRDMARLLSSQEYDRRVMVIDTNNEIAGEGVVPHKAIGRARRMKVGDRTNQYRTMLEAVQNHTPEVLVIDEIGSKLEVAEAIGIQQRGVQLIATTHGRTLTDIIQNPHVRNLLGGVNPVILSAGERAAEGAVTKTRLERRMPPAFDVCVELLGLHKWRVHHNVAEAVDVVLRGLGEVIECELRELDPESGVVKTYYEPFPDHIDEALRKRGKIVGERSKE